MQTRDECRSMTILSLSTGAPEMEPEAFLPRDLRHWEQKARMLTIVDSANRVLSLETEYQSLVVPNHDDQQV